MRVALERRMTKVQRITESKFISLLTLAVGISACSGAASLSDEDVSEQSEAITVGSGINCPSGTNNACTVRNMPLLHQASNLIDVDIPQAYKDVGCYDTSITSVIHAELGNRVSSQALTGRTSVFNAIAAGNNGASPPLTTTRPYEKLSQFYRWVVAGKPLHFPEVLASFAGTKRSSPSNCNPNVYGSCGWLTNVGDDFAGVAHRDFLCLGNCSASQPNIDYLSNDYFKSRMNNGEAMVLGYVRYRASVDSNRNLTFVPTDGMHKVAVSGYQPGTYPLLINDVGRFDLWNHRRVRREHLEAAIPERVGQAIVRSLRPGQRQ
jgi:hypothetical protein